MATLKVENSADFLSEVVTAKHDEHDMTENCDGNVALRHTKPDVCDVNIVRQTSQQAKHYDSNAIAAWDLEDEIMGIVLQHLLQTSYALPVAILYSRRFVSENLASILEHFKIERNMLARDSSVTLNHVTRIDESNLSVVVLHCFQSHTANYAQNFQLGEEFQSIVPYSVFASRNGRRKMEDRHAIVPNLRLLFDDSENVIEQKAAYFAVFDGHGGKECAIYAATHLLSDILSCLRLENDVNPLQSRFSAAIEAGFSKCDSFLQHKCEAEGLKSGTTAACAFIIGHTLFLAWLGDSQILLVDHSKKWTFFSRKHDTKDDDECSKIASRNGLILNILGTNRVNGVVNITRSLGDQFLKPPLSAEPEIQIMELSGQEYFVILGSDGLWDGLSADDCSEIIAEYCKEHDCLAYRNLAQHLVEKSQSNGITDNVTAIVLFMQPLDVIKAAYSNQ